MAMYRLKLTNNFLKNDNLNLNHYFDSEEGAINYARKLEYKIYMKYISDDDPKFAREFAQKFWVDNFKVVKENPENINTEETLKNLVKALTENKEEDTSDEEKEDKSLALAGGVALGLAGGTAVYLALKKYMIERNKKNMLYWQMRTLRNVAYKGIIFSQKVEKNMMKLYIIPTNDFFSDFLDEDDNIKFEEVKKKIISESEKAFNNLADDFKYRNPIFLNFVKEINFAVNPKWLSKEQANEIKEVLEKKAHKTGFTKSKVKVIKP